MSSSKTGRMGGLGKLSDFGKSTPMQTPTEQSQPSSPVDTAPEPKPKPEAESEPEIVPDLQPQSHEPLTTINIKIRRDSHQWLSDTARQVRDNNLDPVPPGERVYPQHLIGVAIELLKSRKVDWSRIKTVKDLEKQLKL